MFSFTNSGFNELEDQLKQIEKNSKELAETNFVSFDKLFPKSFMRKYTKFSSMEELLLSGEFHVETQEDFESIPDTKLDKHIAATTKFKNWKSMLDEATSQYAIKKLGF